MRAGAIVALLALSTPALADPGRVETTGFFGVDYFGTRIGLGSSPDPEQIPQTSPIMGGRLTYIVLPTRHVDLAGEAELAVTPTWTGYGFDGPRMSYFSSVFAYRASVMLRFHPHEGVEPHLLGGAGGETFVSRSPYTSNGTDPVFYVGVGLKLAMAGGWQLRLDGRQGFMRARDGGTTATYEGLLGLGMTFGGTTSPPSPRVEVVDVKPPLAGDRDHDGVPDSHDACPDEPGVATNRGCPEPAPDPDGDGIVGAADKCPNQAEDFDHFQDEDGCPDNDNDGDGIPDAKDACPNDPETRNGFDDDDGCPDTVPADVIAALTSARPLRFEPGRSRLTPAAKQALDRSLAMLRTRPTLHVLITGHPDHGDPDKVDDLANKRAEVVKWYFVEEGIPADQLDTVVGDERKPKGPPIELTVVPKS